MLAVPLFAGRSWYEDKPTSVPRDEMVCRTLLEHLAHWAQEDHQGSVRNNALLMLGNQRAVRRRVYWRTDGKTAQVDRESRSACWRNASSNPVNTRQAGVGPLHVLRHTRIPPMSVLTLRSCRARLLAADCNVKVAARTCHRRIPTYSVGSNWPKSPYCFKVRTKRHTHK